jgi:hypothetical protein
MDNPITSTVTSRFFRNELTPFHEAKLGGLACCAAVGEYEGVGRTCKHLATKLVGSCGCLYSPGFLEEEFSETGFPVWGVLGNWASDIRDSRKFRA